MNQCVDPVVGKILAGWRYDISGIAPEMRGAYEDHFTLKHASDQQRDGAVTYRFETWVRSVPNG